MLLALTPQLLADINTGPAGIGAIGPIVEMGRIGYFAGAVTHETTFRPSNFEGSSFSNLQLWRTDGTTAGTFPLQSAGSFVQITPALLNVDGVLYFDGSSSTTGEELWKTDGTTAGTVVVKDIQPSNFFSA